MMSEPRQAQLALDSYILLLSPIMSNVSGITLMLHFEVANEYSHTPVSTESVTTVSVIHGCWGAY